MGTNTFIGKRIININYMTNFDISHDELFRSLTEGNYSKQQPIKPPRNSKKVNFSSETLEIPRNEKYRLNEKEREDIEALLRNLQEIKTTNEEELLKISVNEEEDDKILTRRIRFEEEGALTKNNNQVNTEEENLQVKDNLK